MLISILFFPKVINYCDNSKHETLLYYSFFWNVSALFWSYKICYFQNKWFSFEINERVKFKILDLIFPSNEINLSSINFVHFNNYKFTISLFWITSIKLLIAHYISDLFTVKEPTMDWALHSACTGSQQLPYQAAMHSIRILSMVLSNFYA